MVKKPFDVGDEVTKWEHYKEKMGKIILIVTRIEESESQSGWCVWASSGTCLHCGRADETWKDLDSDWFVKNETPSENIWISKEFPS